MQSRWLGLVLRLRRDSVDSMWVWFEIGFEMHRNEWTHILMRCWCNCHNIVTTNSSTYSKQFPFFAHISVHFKAACRKTIITSPQNHKAQHEKLINLHENRATLIFQPPTTLQENQFKCKLHLNRTESTRRPKQQPIKQLTNKPNDKLSYY